MDVNEHGILYYIIQQTTYFVVWKGCNYLIAGGDMLRNIWAHKTS